MQIDAACCCPIAAARLPCCACSPLNSPTARWRVRRCQTRSGWCHPSAAPRQLPLQPLPPLSPDGRAPPAAAPTPPAGQSARTAARRTRTARWGLPRCAEGAVVATQWWPAAALGGGSCITSGVCIGPPYQPSPLVVINLPCPFPFSGPADLLGRRGGTHAVRA